MGVRLRATHHCKVLAQRWQLCITRFSYYVPVFRFLPLGRSVELVITVRGPVYFSRYGGISAFAQGYSHGVTSFQNLENGLLDSCSFFISQNYQNYPVVWHRLTAELVNQEPHGVYDQPGIERRHFGKSRRIWEGTLIQLAGAIFSL